MPMHCKACDASIITQDEELCLVCLHAAYQSLPLAMASVKKQEQRRLAVMRRLPGLENTEWVARCLSNI